MTVDKRLLSALEQRELESLLLDLKRVCVPEVDGVAQIVWYRAKQLGLFGDRVLPPEIEVVRVLRDLAGLKRLTIARDEQGGRRVTVMMRSGRTWIVALIPVPGER